jgi:hypothetical protein
LRDVDVRYDAGKLQSVVRKVGAGRLTDDGRSVFLNDLRRGVLSLENLKERIRDPDFNIDDNKNYERDTLLHYAVMSGDFACVKFLVEHGANVDYGNQTFDAYGASRCVHLFQHENCL